MLLDRSNSALLYPFATDYGRLELAHPFARRFLSLSGTLGGFPGSNRPIFCRAANFRRRQVACVGDRQRTLSGLRSSVRTSTVRPVVPDRFPSSEVAHRFTSHRRRRNLHFVESQHFLGGNHQSGVPRSSSGFPTLFIQSGSVPSSTQQLPLSCRVRTMTNAAAVAPSRKSSLAIYPATPLPRYPLSFLW